MRDMDPFVLMGRGRGRGSYVEGAEFVGPLMLDGAWLKGMEAITSGVVLAGLALYLGAGPFVIGLVASSPFFAQFIQFPGLRVVFAVRTRRGLTLGAALAARLLLGCVGFVALAGPSPWALPTLVALLAVSGCLSAVAAVSWAFWMRDLIPQHMYGESFAKRFSAQAVMSVVLTLASGLLLTTATATGRAGEGFALLFFVGAGFGVVSLLFAARLPDVALNPADGPPSLRGLLRAVTTDPERRDVVVFVFFWTCAAFLGLPFVTVYLLREVGLGFTIVSALSAIAMVASLVTYRFWGRSVDRFGPRAVLALAIPGGMVAMFLLPWVAGSSREDMMILTVLFLTLGATFAAVDVAVAKVIARKAPFTGAGTFLAGAGIVRAFSAGAATLVAGIAASVLGGRELRLELSWDGVTKGGSVSGYAFLFVASALLMAYAWHRVLALHAGGATGEVRDVLHEAQVELTGLAPIRGVRIMGQFAAHMASHVLEGRHRPPPEVQRNSLPSSALKRISR